MKERPILFSAPMVRAILAGTKTQTRRVVKPQPLERGAISDRAPGFASFDEKTLKTAWCPYGKPGDRLWVRETWAPIDEAALKKRNAGRVIYRMGHDGCLADKVTWRPSIHMPRWASRITLEVTGVRVERLQAISEADAKAEGVEQFHDRGQGARDGIVMHGIKGVTDTDWVEARDAFRQLWESINGAESWAANPWVWVVKLKRVTP